MNYFDKFQHSIPLVAIALILSLPLAAYFLRQNNLTMLDLRSEVSRIDEQTGDLEEIAPALDELKGYVLTHMNTSLGDGLELPGAYNTAVEKARKAAEDSGSANSKVYALAQEICEDPNILLSARAQCIQDFVLDNAEPGSDPQELEFPPTELYTVNYISPQWSVDPAGISVLLSIILAIWLLYLIIWQVVIAKISALINNDPLE